MASWINASFSNWYLFYSVLKLQIDQYVTSVSDIVLDTLPTLYSLYGNITVYTLEPFYIVQNQKLLIDQKSKSIKIQIAPEISIIKNITSFYTKRQREFHWQYVNLILVVLLVDIVLQMGRGTRGFPIY